MVGKLLVALVLLGSALVAVPASAGSPLEGIGVVWAKDPVARTVTIDETVYRVTARTALRGRDGERIAIAQIPVARNQDGWLRGVSRATVEYRAARAAGGPTLYSLTLIEPPR
jgi:hypothetical protein